VTGSTICGADEKRRAVDDALASRAFARSDQLRAFLRFVCEAEIEDGGAKLTEYVIGVEVLGRPEGYSPTEDSSVRTRAYELRHKLEKLYASELSDAPIQIAIPKGTYIPQFLKRPERIAPDPAAPEPIHSVPKKNTKFPVNILASLAAGLILGALSVLSLGPAPLKSSADPVVAEAWGPLVRRGANVLLVAATPLHLVVGPEGHEAYGSRTYPAPPEAYPLFRQHRPLTEGAKLGMIFTDNVLGMGAVNAIVISANTLGALGASYQILPERTASIGVLHGRNAILFGAPVDSEAISRILEKTPLTVDYEPAVKEFVIRDRINSRNLTPAKDARGDFVEVYGLVTVLNTRDSESGMLSTVVFSGITSVGTHGAAEYFASPRALRHLKSIFARESVSGFPAAFQVVVKCMFNRTLLISYEYETHRVITK